MGHAHSVVLCEAPNNPNATELYVFGSNHFGQLGIGSGASDVDGQNNIAPDDEMHCASQVKSLVPIKLFVCAERIRLIHTKFFSSVRISPLAFLSTYLNTFIHLLQLAVDENGRMYTWGSSPQALRLANQIKRRANAKQKMEETQRREMSKQFEATLAGESACVSCVPSTSKSAYTEAPKSMAAEVVSSILTDIVDENVTSSSNNTAAISRDFRTQSELTIDSAFKEPELIEVLSTTVTAEEQEFDELKDEDVKETVVEGITNTETEITIQLANEVVEELVEEVKPIVTQPLKSLSPLTTAGTELAAKNADSPAPATVVTAPATATATATNTDVDPCEHMTPHLVDTTEVAGQILQVN